MATFYDLKMYISKHVEIALTFLNSISHPLVIRP